MKALVFKHVGQIALEEVEDVKIQDPVDAVVRITTAAICGTDLHMIRGTMAGMRGDGLLSEGTVMGHEGVGIVEAVGKKVHTIKVGDRVIIPSTIGCGHCKYCEKGLYSQCDNANPNGKQAGTSYFGGPKINGGFNGMQAEKVRVPYADANLVKIPDSLSDEQVILLSDILPTAYMAAEMAQIGPKDIVAIFGCGPVGQLVIACAKKMGAQEIFAIDTVPARLEMAKKQGADVIDFNKEDPVMSLMAATNNDGPNKVIDAVGIDAEQPKNLISAVKNLPRQKDFKEEQKKVAPKTHPHDDNWHPDNGPFQVLQWAVEAIAKAGTLSIIGVYPQTADMFPIGMAMNKNLTIRMGNCNHRKYIPLLLDWVTSGQFDPTQFITKTESLDNIVDAYHHFDKREDDWIKVIIKP